MLALAVGTAALLWWLSVFLAAHIRRDRSTECPSCHSHRIRPSWPTLRDKCLSYSGIAPLRCEACRKRFYILKSRALV
jgi:hypothetical protein